MISKYYCASNCQASHLKRIVKSFLMLSSLTFLAPISTSETLEIEETTAALIIIRYFNISPLFSSHLNNWQLKERASKRLLMALMDFFSWVCIMHSLLIVCVLLVFDRQPFESEKVQYRLHQIPRHAATNIFMGVKHAYQTDLFLSDIMS